MAKPHSKKQMPLDTQWLWCSCGIWTVATSSACMHGLLYLCMQDYSSDKYGVLDYRNSNGIGLRRKFGDCTQVITFGGKKCGLSEGALRGFADDALKKLDAGQKEQAVLKWVKKAVSG